MDGRPIHPEWDQEELTGYEKTRGLTKSKALELMPTCVAGAHDDCLGVYDNSSAPAIVCGCPCHDEPLPSLSPSDERTRLMARACFSQPIPSVDTLEKWLADEDTYRLETEGRLAGC